MDTKEPKPISADSAVPEPDTTTESNTMPETGMPDPVHSEILPDTPAPAPVVAPPADLAGIAAEREMQRLSRRSFLWAGFTLAAGYTGWHWLTTRRTEDGVLWPLRRVLEINEDIARDYFQPTRLAPTFARSLAREPRANGDYGLSDDFDPKEWRLSVEGLHGRDEALTLTLEQIKKLPRTEMTTELKCIEGWSEIVHWAGVRLLDFVKQHPPTTQSGDPPDVVHRPDDLVEYVAMETPDGGYYIGLDMASALHPQTLLCYEMNGQPLALEHGAPLRLVIPVKYGIKHIKRIGTIRFTSMRPSDYWAEEGYDWYAGH